MTHKDFELEQLLLGELPEAQARTLREALRTDPALAAKYAALSASNAQTLAQFPPRVVAAEVERRAAASHPRRALWKIMVPAFAAVAAALVVAVPYLNPVESDGIRLKGLEPALHVYRDRSGAIEELLPGAAARAGDRVQLRYVPAGKAWGVLLSIDGRGGVTMHFPLEANAAPRLEPGPSTLPRALQLDDAPQFERFIFITCEARPDVSRVLLAARSLAQQPTARVAPMALEAGCSNQTSFVLSKESP
jgi:hypothetical protein